MRRKTSTKCALWSDVVFWVCRELLDLEPDSKWTRLSMVLVMEALDEEEHAEEILESLEKLKQVGIGSRRRTGPNISQ